MQDNPWTQKMWKCFQYTIYRNQMNKYGMCVIQYTGLLSQEDFYIIPVLKYELGTCYGNLIIV